jgi:chorismate mutase / prephenate dehydratase
MPGNAPPPRPAGDGDRSLEALRLQIDKLDERIVDLLNERARVVVNIGKLKQQHQTPIYAPDRERAVMEKVR